MARTSEDPQPRPKVLGGEPPLVHCSFHKCLTVYFGRVMKAVFNRCLPWSAGFRHYNSDAEEFYSRFREDRVSSINNRALDLARLGRFRISRFVRDPRDLVVSGYFYHRKGKEEWTRLEAPTEEDWRFANGVVPEGLRRAGTSFSSYLRSLPEEEGLLAELEFRTRHFESMDAWPEDHPDILLRRYEEIPGNEEKIFGEIFSFYGFSRLERFLAGLFVRRYSLRRRAADPHVRNPSAGQWRRHFTPRVREAFDDRFPGLIERLGYPPE